MDVDESQANLAARLEALEAKIDQFTRLDGEYMQTALAARLETLEALEARVEDFLQQEACMPLNMHPPDSLEAGAWDACK